MQFWKQQSQFGTLNLSLEPITKNKQTSDHKIHLGLVVTGIMVANVEK
jgi:hypothetical protein